MAPPSIPLSLTSRNTKLPTNTTSTAAGGRHPRGAAGQREELVLYAAAPRVHPNQSRPAPHAPEVPAGRPVRSHACDLPKLTVQLASSPGFDVFPSNVDSISTHTYTYTNHAARPSSGGNRSSSTPPMRPAPFARSGLPSSAKLTTPAPTPPTAPNSSCTCAPWSSSPPSAPSCTSTASAASTRTRPTRASSRTRRSRGSSTGWSACRWGGVNACACGLRFFGGREDDWWSW